MTSSRARSILVHTALLLAASVAIFPFVWLLCASLKIGPDVFRSLTLPWGDLSLVSFDNFRSVLARDDFLKWVTNSIFVSCAQTALVTFVCSAAGYVLAKHPFPGKRALQIALLVTLLVPTQVLIPGSYELMRAIGWIDRFAAVILPGSVSVFGVFLYRQAMRGLPDDLLNAARIDGCSEPAIYWNIALPLLRPMTAAFTLMSFLASWNSLIWPQLMLIDPAKQTLPVAISNLSGLASSQQNPGLLMAATVLSLAPVILLFLVLQKHFVAGLTSGALRD